MKAHIKAQVATFMKKAFKIDGETFTPETEATLNRLADRIIVVSKWSVKIFVVVTLFMLIFGESRYIEGAPMMWRVQYEWKHLFNQSDLRICYGIDETNLINVETAIDLLRERTESEQKLLQICKEAETEGIGDIVINPPDETTMNRS